ncbi:carbohydrate kinase [Opitutaceae bacterium TAV4]|nr:carbohydrate kinase [Opitutaceae bacterium TAV4]RRJ99806.1 carbohydrate kinase [Opitutaceae bacterium TAV3]
MTTQDLLSHFPKSRVLVIGDIMVDHYLWGDVTRISPEAPVPVVHVTKETHLPGGAANVANNLAALGVRVELIGALGEDDSGQRLRNLLAMRGIESERCLVSPKIPTIVKTRVVARTQQVCRIDHEDTRTSYDLHASDPAFVERICAAISEADAVIVSDYAKGVVTQPFIDLLMEQTKRHKVLLAVDPKPARKLVYNGIGLMTPNRHEALEMAGMREPAHGEPYPLEAVCRRLYEWFAPELLVVTLGADGMAVCQAGQIVQTLPTEAREVFDVSGAGDTVIATLTAALIAGADAVTAARIANRAAGIVVSKVGTVTVSPDELLAAG